MLRFLDENHHIVVAKAERSRANQSERQKMVSKSLRGNHMKCHSHIFPLREIRLVWLRTARISLENDHLLSKYVVEVIMNSCMEEEAGMFPGEYHIKSQDLNS